MIPELPGIHECIKTASVNQKKMKGCTFKGATPRNALLHKTF